MRMKDKVAFISGGASEMACAIEKTFLREGAKVVLVDISEAGLAATVAELGEEYRENICVYQADVTKLEQMEAAAAFANETFGRIDVMVNCTGIIRHKPIDEMEAGDWASVIAVNLTGAYHSFKCVVPYMKKQNYGRIMTISSIGGRCPRTVGVNYSASKAGIIGMTMTLAGELAPYNITVNSIAPGPMKGRMFAGTDPELVKKFTAGIPLGRMGTMQDVANGALYLCSDEASWVTGEVLDINGGLYCKG